MAKREISSTLRNLKFMQRASRRGDETATPKVEDDLNPKPHETSASFKRCIVIMEGNPHPGAVKGRMSFQSFNPSIDKLHQEDGSDHEMPQPNTNHTNGSSKREDEISMVRPEDSNSASPSSISDIDYKRKQPEMDRESPSPSKLQKFTTGDGSGQSSSQSNSRGSHKQQQKHEKLNWNLLRPPKPQPRRS